MSLGLSCFSRGKTNVVEETVKVLLVVTGMGAGGLENYILNILSAIDRNKFKVTIACTGGDSAFYKDELIRLGVRTIFCPNPYSQIGYICRIFKIIRSCKIDAVCDFRDDFSAPTLLAAKLAGVRSRVAMYRSTRRGFRPDPFRNFYAYMIHQCTKCLATKIIGNTRKVLDAFYPDRGEDEKYAVIYNGVDLKKFSPGLSGEKSREELGIPVDSIVVGHVGRFHISKNHPTILETFAKLRREVKNVHLLLVGYGVLRDKIENLIAELGIGSSVTLAGRRKDIPSMLAAMDIFFYPSIYEGLPNALLEAMACGLPIVASNIPEIVEITPPDFAKQLFDTDDVEEYVKALKEMCEREEKRKDFGARARQWIEERFSLRVSAEELCKIWTADL